MTCCQNEQYVYSFSENDWQFLVCKLGSQDTVFSLVNAAPLGIHIEISASLLISAVPLNAALIRTDTIFY